MKKIAWLFGALIAVILIAVVVLPLVIDPNDYKDEIATAVESATGRNLTMDGDIELSVFPWLGLDIGSVSLSNVAGFSSAPFAEVTAVQIRVKLLPLLSKQLEMDTVVLKSLHVSLETNEDGATNWSDLAGDRDSAEKKSEPSTKTTGSSGQLALAGLAIGGVEIQDASVLWDDRKAGVRYQIDDIELTTGAIAPGETVPVKLVFQLASKEPEISGPIKFSSSIALSEDGQKIRLDDASLTLDLSGKAMPDGRLQATLGFNSSVDLKAGQLNVAAISLEALALRITGHINGTKILADTAAFDGAFKIQDFVPRKLVQSLGQPLPETADPAVLGKANGSLGFKATMDSMQLSDLQFQLDDSLLTGTLGITDFAKLAIRYALTLDEIDVDRYLPPVQEDASPVVVTPTAAAAAATQLIPVDTLRELDINGTMQIIKLKVAQLRSSDLKIKLVAKDGLIRMNPVSARLYEGQYKGDVQLDVRGKQPKIALNEHLSNLQIGPLLKDVVGESMLTGKTQARLQLNARGQTEDEFKKTLNGKVSFSFENGAVKGFNLAKMIRNTQAKINGKPMPADNEPDQTDFSELSGSANISNGIVKNQDLLAMSPLLRVQGKGTVDLPKENIDYQVAIKVVGSLKGQGGKEWNNLKGLSVPVQVEGTFAKPRYKIKLDELLKQEAADKFKKKLDKKLEKKFGNTFKGLFK